VEPEPAPAFAVSFDVRYGEVDLQGVVFNAHYLAYCDHVSDTWFRSIGFDPERLGWDFMVKAASIVWHRSLVLGDRFEVEARLASRGRTSFVVSFEGRRLDGSSGVRSTVDFEATVTYVGVDYHSRRPTPMPEEMIEALGSGSLLPADHATS
jgi:acyl-CoA thioester hydrolase